jgi:LacI family transcriptional regulator
MVAAPKASRLLAYVQAEYRSRDGRVEGVSTGIAGAMFEGAAAEAARADYEFLFRATTAGELNATLQQLTRRYRLAGVVAASFAEEKILRGLGARELPVVLLDHDLPVPQVSSIREDSAAGSKLAVEHLAALGHRRIALAHWHQSDLNPWRLRGYRAALRTAGLGVRRRYELTTEITQAGAAGIVAQLAGLEPRPTAVVCFNNTLARYVVEAARDHGWSTPDDLSVVGCGGEEILGLTTAQSDWQGLGRRAAAMLIHRLTSGDAPSAPIEHEQPPPILRIGGSTAPPPGAPLLDLKSRLTPRG